MRRRRLEVQEWSSGERCGPETEVVESLCIDSTYSMEQVGTPGEGEVSNDWEVRRMAILGHFNDDKQEKRYQKMR